jgi:hypothetical protein
MPASESLSEKIPPANKRRRRRRTVTINGVQCTCVEATEHGYVMAPVDDPTTFFPLTHDELDRILGQYSFRF